jgi:hypothetical protein
VVPTGRGGEVVEPLDLFRAQLDTVCGAVLLHPCGSLVPGIGTMSSPLLKSQARAICAGVAPPVRDQALPLNGVGKVQFFVENKPANPLAISAELATLPGPVRPPGITN